MILFPAVTSLTAGHPTHAPQTNPYKPISSGNPSNRRGPAKGTRRQPLSLHKSSVGWGWPSRVFQPIPALWASFLRLSSSPPGGADRRQTIETERSDRDQTAGMGLGADWCGMVVSVVPPNPIIIIILSPSREVRRERRAPIIKSTIHKFLSALSSPHGSRRLLPSSAASVVSRGPCLCRALSFTVARETETRAPPHSLHYAPVSRWMKWTGERWKLG